MNTKQPAGWRVLVSPPYDWSGSNTLENTYPTREAAVAAAAADPILQPDCYGLDPLPSVVPVDGDGMVMGCTCYGQFCCAACTLARLDGQLR